jgi:hypothetical protein
MRVFALLLEIIPAAPYLPIAGYNGSRRVCTP